MQDGCKVYMDPYMASNRSCFMVIWIIFKNHLLEVGLTQNWETMALRTLKTVDLLYLYHVWEPAWIETHWNNIWLRARSHVTSHLHLRVCDHTTWFLKVCWDRLWTLSFGLSQFNDHGSWLVCEVALSLCNSLLSLGCIGSILQISRATG